MIISNIIFWTPKKIKSMQIAAKMKINLNYKTLKKMKSLLIKKTIIQIILGGILMIFLEKLGLIN
jgi:hypothetical protein